MAAPGSPDGDAAIAAKPSEADDAVAASRQGAGQGAGVLFVCTHNAIRSPMAGALYRRIVGPDRPVATAGVLSCGPIDPLAARAMGELGVDLSRHHHQTLVDIETAGGDVGAFDAVIALSAAAAERATAYGAGDRLEVWDAPDPTAADGDAEQRLTAYRGLRDALAARIRARFRPR